MPYGRKTDPIDAFAFEEFTRQSGLSGMLWGHGALIPAFLLAERWAQLGNKMQLGKIMGVGDIPYYVYIAEDGEQTALPCTERLYSERQAAQVGAYHIMPLVSLRGRPELRLASFASLAGKPLAGLWALFDPTPEPEPEPEPEAAAEEEPVASDSDSSDDASDSGGSDTPSDDEAAPAGDTDLDALLASLGSDTPAAESADETEPDLDALLASLK